MSSDNLQNNRPDAAQDDSFDLDLATVARLIDEAKRILFITGAGISADSGLPTYRGIGGLYNDRVTDDGLPIEEALSGRMLAYRPEITWKYLAEIEANCRGALPNPAHHEIARLETEKEVTVLTQNIDGLHRAAGSSSVIEIHGSMHRLSCTGCGVRIEVIDYAGLGMPPTCAECASLLRPDVVLFGEALPAVPLTQLIERLENGVDLVLTIGTTSVFPYIAEPVLFARRNGIPSVEINPGESAVSHLVDVRLQMGAASAMTGIRNRRRSHP